MFWHRAWEVHGASAPSVLGYGQAGAGVCGRAELVTLFDGWEAERLRGRIWGENNLFRNTPSVTVSPLWVSGPQSPFSHDLIHGLMKLASKACKLAMRSLAQASRRQF